MKLLMILGALLGMAGVVLIFDARLIVKKWFGFGDQNEATSGLKISGLVLSVLGELIILLCA